MIYNYYKQDPYRKKTTKATLHTDICHIAIFRFTYSFYINCKLHTCVLLSGCYKELNGQGAMLSHYKDSKRSQRGKNNHRPLNWYIGYATCRTRPPHFHNNFLSMYNWFSSSFLEGRKDGREGRRQKHRPIFNPQEPQKGRKVERDT